MFPVARSTGKRRQPEPDPGEPPSSARDTRPVTSTVAVLDTPGLRGALEHAPDPQLARRSLGRLLEEHPELAASLRDVPLVRDALVAIACASRVLTDAIVRDPSLLAPLCDHEGFAREQGREGLDESIARCAGACGAGALRRWKRQQLVRIAARDLLGVADLPAVGRELAALAEVCLDAACRMADPVRALAVIGMGKLGGRELNYASDIDVLFVHDADPAEAERAARRVIAVMAEPTEDGIVFRTDADLRPEGAAGPLTRSLESYLAYYELWARAWEFQALIKARPVAGDRGLGARFADSIQPFVWPDVLPPDAVREIRAMKARAEGETRRRGLDDRELKRGRGGIRDIEFAVQLLQVVHGRHDPSIRAHGTLEALAALRTGGYVETGDARVLDGAYRFLRTVEHRLQLWAEQQTHTLPADPEARTRLARVLGFRDRGEESALERFDAEHRARQGAVRSVHEKLFFAPILDTLAGRGGPLSAAAAEERLRAFGFTDLGATRGALDELTRGFSRTSRVLEQLLPVLLEWCSESADPDLALLQLRRLSEGATRAASLGRAFRDAPGAAQRSCHLLGASRMLGDALRHQPEFVRTLGDDAALGSTKDRARLVEEALATVEWRARDVEARRSGLRRFKRRELLRIGARDVLGFADLVTTGHELSTLAEACLEAALASLAPGVPFAVIGLGRLGGRDLSYASDVDVVFVYDGDGAGPFREAERVAEALLVEVGAPTPEGRTFRIDVDLRPEGKRGSLTRSLDGYRRYWERWALTWELQALTKARPVAGDAEVARRFVQTAHRFVYRSPLPEEAVREIRRMKARIERERIPPGEDPQFHLKLGRGSLSDVEFTTQLLQLRHGGEHTSLRTSETVVAIEALVALGLLDPQDADSLRESYGLCSAARNARYLVTGSTRESLPTDPAEAQRVERLMGYVQRPHASLRDDYRRVTRRARTVVERVFYGQDR